MNTHHLFVVALAGLLSACASTQPTGIEVTYRERTRIVSAENEGPFLSGGASSFRLKPSLLPPHQQREEFDVRWRNSGVTLVTFDYRQANRPGETRTQTTTIDGRQQTLFIVGADEYLRGGKVTAWRVTLRRDDEVLAERKSAMW